MGWVRAAKRTEGRKEKIERGKRRERERKEREERRERGEGDSKLQRGEFRQHPDNQGGRKLT